MLWISFLVVAVFIWLVFNIPFKGETVHDTYEFFLDQIRKEDGEQRLKRDAG